MRKYQSHKIVEGAKAVDLESWENKQGYTITDEFGGVHRVDNTFFGRGPMANGDYLVKYEDGYLSWSPKAVFEAGNKPLDEVDQPVGISTRIAMQHIFKDAQEQYDLSGTGGLWGCAWKSLMIAADRLDAMMSRCEVEANVEIISEEGDAAITIPSSREIWIPTNEAGEMPVRAPGACITLIMDEALHFDDEELCILWCDKNTEYLPASWCIDARPDDAEPSYPEDYERGREFPCDYDLGKEERRKIMSLAIADAKDELSSGDVFEIRTKMPPVKGTLSGRAVAKNWGIYWISSHTMKCKSSFITDGDGDERDGYMLISRIVL